VSSEREDYYQLGEDYRFVRLDEPFEVGDQVFIHGSHGRGWSTSGLDQATADLGNRLKLGDNRGFGIWRRKKENL
jgi:hypothetical protein